MSSSVADAGEFARQIARNRQLTVPVDLSDLIDLMEALGVRYSEDDQLIDAGRFRRGVPFDTITIRRTDSLVRRKFTAAHELGHALTTDWPWVSRPQEERWCDEFAAELLLPSAWVREHFSGRPERLDTLQAVANRADVSVASALVALHNAVGWTSALLTFRFGRREWRLWRTGYVPEDMAALLNTVRGTSDVLAPATDFSRVARLPLGVGERSYVIDAEVSGSGSNRWVLIAASVLDEWRRPGTGDVRPAS